MYITATVSETKSAGFGVTARLGGAGCDIDFISNAVFDGAVKCVPFRHYSGDEENRSVKTKGCNFCRTMKS